MKTRYYMSDNSLDDKPEFFIINENISSHYIYDVNDKCYIRMELEKQEPWPQFSLNISSDVFNSRLSNYKIKNREYSTKSLKEFIPKSGATIEFLDGEVIKIYSHRSREKLVNYIIGTAIEDEGAIISFKDKDGLIFCTIPVSLLKECIIIYFDLK